MIEVLVNPATAEDVLFGWKSIAEYLRTTVKTCRRWYRYDGLPAQKATSGKIFAIKIDLLVWIRVSDHQYRTGELVTKDKVKIRYISPQC